MGGRVIEAVQGKGVVLVDQFSLGPEDRAGGHGQIHQAHVADVEADLAVARHQVGLALGRVQADSDGGDVRHRADH
ncbi:hypothetical protein D9M71_765760 [compost metagenome]